MYVIDPQGRLAVNAEKVERFHLVQKPDAYLIVASYGRDVQPLTVARYEDREKAHKAFLGLMYDLDVCHQLPV